MNELDKIICRARELSWERFGKNIDFYHPGMFRYNGSWGRYPAISITGKECELQCDHCKAKILETMEFATDPDELINKCKSYDERGDIGCLISGGSRKNGTLPWEEFVPAIKEIRKSTDLFLSIHSGIIDRETARKLKNAGIDQALIDVIGDEDTLRKVYHVDFGIDKISESMSALKGAGIPIAPHIVAGLDYGAVKGEFKAIEMIKRYEPEVVVIVSLMSLPGTPMSNVSAPCAGKIAEIIARTRLEMPNVPISMGCARDRSDPDIDVAAVDCGVNRMAIPSDEAIKRAKDYGLIIKWKKTCCSVPIHQEVENHEEGIP